MLWSLVKILLFVGVVLVLTWAAVQLMEVSGQAVIMLPGIEFTLTPLQMVLALLVFALLVWLLFKIIGLLIAFLHFLNGDETAISRYFNRNRERRGFAALADGMVALASGEGQLALTKAQRAERLLERPELTSILAAQAAEMAGDHKRAEESYKRLLADERTRFVGIRGIMKQRLAAGDSETALKLAQKAFELKPRHEEVQDTLLRLQAESHDWAGARTTLGAKLKSGSLPRDVYKRRDAVLALSEAKDVFSDESSIEAREASIEANRQSPDLIPAAVMAARAYIKADNKRYATRVLRKAWEVHPHPDLAAAFAEIEPEETPAKRLKRFTALTKHQTQHPETKMLLAELYIAAEDFPAARRALGDLPETAPTARNLALMASIERGAGADDRVVRGWLTKALSAPRGPQWVCDKCHAIHAQWAPICDNCGGFDTLSWTTPPREEITLPGNADMLPLMTESPEEREAHKSGPESALVIRDEHGDLDPAAVPPGSEPGESTRPQDRGDEARQDKLS
ncbi:heme biosynthesis protein HemY [Pseudoroseicyclus tamaricis]|uniref:Tetratricopeptide repeat protein n=1 Tax=Pseudoroseicyclus tamaricis TaxID=2705421 RepID=A0A6B2JXQ0_9RHOB|nr:heme biosynthesis HemY N-terminal domain-containing protein [Pseudoroseicyclus tamaricis]NDV02635.1 tetratricopeptide repeat protein [Pseudoroseicyclus tamaricis]